MNKTYISTKTLSKTYNEDLIEEILEQEQVKSLFKIQELANELKILYESIKTSYISINDENIAPNASVISYNSTVILSKSQNPENTFEKPMSLRVCMFQLSESSNLERITNVLQNLVTYSSQNLLKLCQKYLLDEKLLVIAQKYCNGDYGFDLTVSKLGHFQKSFVYVVLKTFTSEILIEKLIGSEFFELYGQLVEEALIFAYDYTFKTELPKGCVVFEFLDQALEVFTLVMSHKFIHYIQGIKDILEKLEERMKTVQNSSDQSR